MRRAALLLVLVGCTDDPGVPSPVEFPGMTVTDTIDRPTESSGGVFARIYPSDPDAPTWSLGVQEDTHASPFEYTDRTMQLGYNYERAQRQNLDEPAVFLQFEHAFQTGPGGMNRVTETHLSGQDVAGNEHRYFSNMSAWDGSFGETALSGTIIQFYDWTLKVLGKLSATGLFLTVPVSVQTDAPFWLTAASADNSKSYLRLGAAGSYLGSSLLLESDTADTLAVTSSVGATSVSMYTAGMSRLAQVNLGTNGWWEFHLDDPRNLGGRIQVFYNTGGMFFHAPDGTLALHMGDQGTVRVEKPLELNGGLRTIGTRPTLASCGTGATQEGDDSAGTVGVGGGTSSCTVVFANAFTTLPTCVVSSPSGITLQYSKSNTSLTVTSAQLASSSFDYVCVAH